MADARKILWNFAILANPLLQGFAGFGLSASLTSFTGDIRSDICRHLARELNLPLVAATQLGLTTGEILAQAKSARWHLDQLNALLETLGPASALQSIGALERAMLQVKAVAEALKTADLSKDDNGLEKLLSDCAKAFASAADVAEGGLRTLSNLHSKVVELHSTRLTPLNERIANLSQLFPADLQRTTERYNTAKSQAAVEDETAQKLSAAVEKLRRTIEENRHSSEISDGFFDFLTLGIARAVNGEPPDPFDFRGQMKRAQESLDAANASRERATNTAYVMRFQMDQAREQLMFLEALRGDVPKLQRRLDRTKNASIALQQQFTDIKDRASQVSLRIGQVQSTAVNTRDTAVVQDEFIHGLLTICRQVLIDARLLDEVKAVTDIVDQGFKLAAISRSDRAEINLAVAQISQQQSIYDSGVARNAGPLGIPLSKRASEKFLLAQSASPIDRFEIGPLGLPMVRRGVVKA